jgi:RNA polymerase sigma factor (TIGR02999 family)
LDSHSAFIGKSEIEMEFGSKSGNLMAGRDEMNRCGGFPEPSARDQYTCRDRSTVVDFLAHHHPRAYVGGRVMPPGSISAPQVTELLVHWRQGDPHAREKLIPVIYGELRRIARSHLRSERPDHTLESGALVHEAYVRLCGEKSPEWKNRAHFFGVAAQVMRHILVDHARQRRAAKRGGGVVRIALDPNMALPQTRDVDLLALDDALDRLAEMDAQQSRLIELRFFGGLSIVETAAVLNVSAATVKREWATARAWLQREMKAKGRGK